MSAGIVFDTISAIDEPAHNLAANLNKSYYNKAVYKITMLWFSME